MLNSSKILRNHECFDTITQEIYKISKIYYIIHEKVYKKVKLFQNMMYKA